jgi:hypothetical protein
VLHYNRGFGFAVSEIVQLLSAILVLSKTPFSFGAVCDIHLEQLSHSYLQADFGKEN